MTADLGKVRKDYQKRTLLEADLAANPMEQMAAWLADAKEAQPDDYNAMTLSTLDDKGFPSSRIVLLRSLDDGLVFYTNYASDKGRELAANANCSLLFFWPQLERQVRITTTSKKVSSEESDAYFASRPRESQIGAWASQQSESLASRSDLEDRLAELVEQYKDNEVPRPPHWGGYRLTPSAFEFWQGRPSRLHDRLTYSLQGSTWEIKRLQP